MLMRMVQLFTSFFENFNVISLGIAVLFGAIWTACFRPPLFRKFWLWAIFPFGAVITFLAVAAVQRPVLTLIEHVVGSSGHGEQHSPALLSVIPMLLVSGLIQEGAKMVPAVTYWQMEKRKISPVLGLQIGAVAGAGFGILEAIWTFDALFASGWTFELVQINGPVELFIFWETLFIVAMNVTAGALSGYGLAKGWGWQFYLLASLVHVGLYVISFLIHAHVISHIYGDLVLTVYVEVIMVTLIIVGERTAKRDEED
jgi:hypothetical protein